MPPCQHMQGRNEGVDSPAQAATQLADDMAALLAGSALQLLGGACVSSGAAAASLQASADAPVGSHVLNSRGICQLRRRLLGWSLTWFCGLHSVSRVHVIFRSHPC